MVDRTPGRAGAPPRGAGARERRRGGSNGPAVDSWCQVTTPDLPVEFPARSIRAGRVPSHEPLPECAARGQGVVPVADDSKILHRGRSPLGPRDDVVELEPVGRAAGAATVNRPAAVTAIAGPDGAFDGCRNRFAGAAAAWRRRLRRDERERWRGLLRLGPGFHWSLRARCRRSEHGPRLLHLAPRLRLPLQQQPERSLEHLLCGGVRDRVREPILGGLQLPQELATDGDVEPAQVYGERLDVVARSGWAAASPSRNF